MSIHREFAFSFVWEFAFALVSWCTSKRLTILSAVTCQILSYTSPLIVFIVDQCCDLVIYHAC